MKNFPFSFFLPAALAALLCAPGARAAMPDASAAAIRRNAMAFLTRVYAWQGIRHYQIVQLAPPRGELRRMTVLFSRGTQHARRKYWVTVDGRHILNGKRSPLLPAGAPARPATRRQIRARVLAFLRKTYPKGPVSIQKIGPPDSSGIRRIAAKVPAAQVFWVTRDGRSILSGEKDPLNGDPWAALRRKIQMRGAPALGPANAPVTIVEFSDLECPYCREESGVLRRLREQMPRQVRLVFKLFPLTHIHPWAMDAALAATCVARQKPSHFWPFEQAVFDAQPQLDNLLPQNLLNPLALPPVPPGIPARLRDFALESGSKPGLYDACMKSPATRAAVGASLRNGEQVGVESTPTLFINGQRIPGAVPLKDLEPLVAWLAKQPRQPSRKDTGRLALRRKMRGPQCGLCRPLPPLPAKSSSAPHR